MYTFEDIVSKIIYIYNNILKTLICGKIVLETEKIFLNKNWNRRLAHAETHESAILVKSHNNFVYVHEFRKTH